jgi:hypothetical protein
VSQNHEPLGNFFYPKSMLPCSEDNIGEGTLETAGAGLALQQQPLPPSTDFNFNNLQWLPTANCCLTVTELTAGMCFFADYTEARNFSFTARGQVSEAFALKLVLS